MSWYASVPNHSVEDNQSMLNRQYGIAAPSSVVPVAHPEDSQPNEKNPGRHRNLPPRVANTARPPRFDRILSNTGQSFTQYARRGSGHSRGHRGGPMFNSGRQEMQSRSAYNQRERISDRNYPSSASSSRSRIYNAESQVQSISKEPPADVESRSMAETSNSVPAPGNQTILPPPWIEYRSPSPKLPPDPLRRRTLHEAPPIHSQSQLPKPPPPAIFSRLPLPGRKRRIQDPPPEAPPPAQKLKLMELKQPTPPRPLYKIEDELSPEKPTSTSVKNPLNIDQDVPSPSPPVIFSPKRDHRSLTIKDEPSSPEPTITPRKLVTEACKFWPIPDNCRKSVPSYSDNRLAFAKERSKELSKLGLKRGKTFFREDGLVIEWTSEIPVWNDTLLPEASTSTKTPPKSSRDCIGRQGSQPVSMKRKRESPEVIDIDALPTPVVTPKKSRVSRSANSEDSQPSPSTTKEQEQPSVVIKSLTPSSSSRKSKPKDAKHWAAGLSKEDIRNLGKRDQSAPISQLPPTPPSHSKASNLTVTPSRSEVERTVLSVLSPFASPTKRPALPTRINQNAARRAADCPLPNTTPIKKETDNRQPSTATTTRLSSDEIGSPLPNKSNFEPRQSVPANENAVSPLGQESLTTPELPKTPILAEHNAGSKDDMTFLPDRLPLDRHVSSDVVVAISSGLVLDSEAKDIQSEGPSAEHLVQVQTSETGQSTVEGGISGDSPEYEMAKDFIKRFIVEFDSDRPRLWKAYSKDALFSYRVHSKKEGGVTSVDDTLDVTSDESTKSNTSVDQGGSIIVQKLQSCFKNYYFSLRGLPMVHYDLAALPRKVVSSTHDGDSTTAVDDEEDVGLILATVHSEIIKTDLEDENLDRTLTLDQSFVLRRRLKRDDDDDGDGDQPGLGLDSQGEVLEDPWPLVAISHQMTLRDEPLLPSEKVDECLHWHTREFR